MSEIIIQILILGGFTALLVKSAIFAIESIVKFSKITGIGELAAVSVNFGILSSLIGFTMIAPFALFVFIRKALVKKWHSFLLFGIYAAFLLTIYEIQLYLGGIKIG